MDISLVKGTELDAQHIAAWAELQRQSPGLDNPFFCPQFTQLATKQWKNVEVAVMSEGGNYVGFFPFERYRQRVAAPVASVINDFHGVVVRPDLEWTIQELMQGAGLKSFEFDHLPASQSAFNRYMTVRATSPYMDLSQGFEHYNTSRREAGSKVVTRVRRKIRKLGREVGPVRFELHTTDDSILDTLMQWKAAASDRQAVACITDVPWFAEFSKQLCAVQDANFAGMLTALYAGDTPVAAHLGMRSASVLHWWFPSYDRRFAKYSPGLALLLLAAEQGSQQGITRVDLGKGYMEYKESMKSGDAIVTEGIVDARPWVSLPRRSWLQVRDRLRHSRLRQAAHRIDRALTRGRLALGFDR